MLDPADDSGNAQPNLETSGSTCNLFQPPIPSTTEPNTIVLFQPDPIEPIMLQQYGVTTTTVSGASAVTATVSTVGPISSVEALTSTVESPSAGNNSSALTDSSPNDSIIFTAAIPTITIEQQLLSAAAAGHTDRLLQLLQIGADPTCLDAHGRSCLHLAAENGWTATTQVLLQQPSARHLLHHADRVSGRTPLHAASSAGRQSVCEMLLNSGADPRKLDGDGRSSMQVAQQAGNPALSAYLQCERFTHEFYLDNVYETLY